MHRGIWWESQKERNDLEDIHGGWIILKCIYLTRDRDPWWALMNTAIFWDITPL
jgi:hypothetical protein